MIRWDNEPETNYILITDRRADAEVVADYLPEHYRIIGRNKDKLLVIAGKDVYGWTADAYVMPRLQSALFAPRKLAARPLLATDYDPAARWPRLLRAMRWSALLADTEASSALRQYVQARDGILHPELMASGGAEAVAHVGGPLAVIRHAIACRHLEQRTRI